VAESPFVQEDMETIAALQQEVRASQTLQASFSWVLGIKFNHPEAEHYLKRNKPDRGAPHTSHLIKTTTTPSVSTRFFSYFLQLLCL